MKSKSFSWLWLIGVPFLMTMAAASPEAGNLLLTLALPFTWMGEVLREMSQSGAVGNLTAWVLYGMVCISPMLLFRKEDGWKTNGLLILGCGVLFWIMWYMVNPGMMPQKMRNEIGQAIYAGAFYSVMVTWGVVKLMCYGKQMEQTQIYGAFRLFLLLCAAGFTIGGLGFGLGEFRMCLNAVGVENTALTDSQLMPTYLFLTLDFCLGVLEHLLVIWILVQGVLLLYALEDDPYSDKCYQQAQNLSAWCNRAIPIVAGSSLILNLSQVLFAGILVNVNLTLHLPVLSLAAAFGMMAFVLVLKEGKILKDDNDLFI